MKRTRNLFSLLIFIFLLISCKQNTEHKKKTNLFDKKDSLIINTKKNSVNKAQQSLTYFYKDEQTNDSQILIIKWNNKNSFNFSLKVDNDMCQYKDKGEAFLQEYIYIVKEHPVLKKIKFNENKTEVKLICKYGEIRDECDPVEEFIMVLMH